MRAIVSPEVAKFVDGLVARHVVSADPHVVERLKVEVENFVNDFTTAEEESVGTTELMGIPLTTAMVNKAGFGFSIPENATITGISGEVQTNSSAAEFTKADWDSLKAIHRTQGAGSAAPISETSDQADSLDTSAAAQPQTATEETTATEAETKGDGSESN